MHLRLHSLTAILIALGTITAPAAETGRVQLDAAVDSASFLPGRALTPGSLISLFGDGLAAGAATAEILPLPTLLESTRVRVNGAEAPLLYVSSRQINFQLPFELTGSQATIVVAVNGVESAPLVVSLASGSPGLFTLLSNGVGPGAIVHADGTLVSEASPVRPGETLLLFATGLGPFDPAVPSGMPAPGTAPLSVMTRKPRVWFNDVEGDVRWSGLAPFFVGVCQINVRVPATVTDPHPTVVIGTDEISSAPVTAGGPGLLDVNPAYVRSDADSTITLRGLNLGAEVEIAGRRFTATPAAGSLQTLEVTIPAGSLEPGAWPVVGFLQAGGSEQRSNPIELVAAPSEPVSISTSQIVFTKQVCDVSPSTETIAVTSDAPEEFSWTATTSAEWLSVSPTQGASSTELIVTADPLGLPAGTHNAQVSIETPFGTSARVQVRLVIPRDAGLPAPVLSPSVYVIDSLQRVQRDDPLPAIAETAASLLAARREYEAFQIVINGEGGGFGQVNASMSFPLTGPGCVTLPSENVTFYREHYVEVKQPSNGGFGGAQAGVYPDALIPFRNPFTGEPIAGGTYPSAPFDVEVSQNQPVYVEVFVPADAVPGSYVGLVRLTHDSGEVLADVPVVLNVVNFTLPVATSSHSQFQPYDSGHEKGPLSYFQYLPESEKHNSLAKAFDEFLIAHRTMPEVPRALRPFPTDPRGNIIIPADREPEVRELLQRPDYQDFDLPFSDFAPFPDGLGSQRQLLFNYLQSASRYLEELGVLPKATFRQIDEPTSDEHYRIARQMADLIHQADENFRVAVSGDFSDPRVETFLHGHIDTYIMANWAFDPLKAQARLDAGDEVWTYTSLVQNAANPSPFWQLDFPLLHYRVPTWINFRYGLNGLVYWTTDHWEQIIAQGKSLWREPCTFRGSENDCYNGDGSLIYPGREINYRVPKGAFGGASRTEVWGPVPSLRLKTIRDGLEDYEWLAAAAEKNPDAARQAAIDVGCNGKPDPGDTESNCFFDFSRSRDSFRQARERLAEVLEQP